MQCQKNLDFAKLLWAIQKSEKLILRRSGGQTGHQSESTLVRGGPQDGHARDQKVERGQLVRGKKGQEGKKASGKMEKRKSWKGKVGKKERKRDLTRQWARGPANFS